MSSSSEFRGNDADVDVVFFRSEGYPETAFRVFLQEKNELPPNGAEVVVYEFVTERIGIYAEFFEISERNHGSYSLSASDLENGRENRAVQFGVRGGGALVKVSNELHVIGSARKQFRAALEGRRNGIGVSVTSRVVEDSQKQEVRDFRRNGRNAPVVFDEFGNHVASGGIGRIHPADVSVARTVVVDVENRRRFEQFAVFLVQFSDHRYVARVANDDEIVFSVRNRRFYPIAHSEKVVERANGPRIHGVDDLAFRTRVRLEGQHATERVAVEIVGGGKQNGARFVEELGYGKEYCLIFHEIPLRSG